MAEVFSRFTETYLHLYSPSLLDVYLIREQYPEELRVCLKVKYDKCELKFGAYVPQYEGKVHILYSSGVIEFKKSEGTKWIEVLADKVIPTMIENTKSAFSICSKPLNISEIHRVADELRGESIDIRWSLSGYGYILPSDLYHLLKRLEEEIRKTRGISSTLSILPTSFVVIKAEGTPSRIDYIIFTKKVIAQADLVKRLFIEVLMEPLTKEMLDSIKDHEIREALEILFKKQSVLREALEEYRRAITASDYKNVISKVRGAIENLTQGAPMGNRVFQALRKAFLGLNIIEEVEPGSGTKAREVDAIISELDRLSSTMFRISSKLGVHQPDYVPKPYIHDAEFLLHQALTFTNYLIKVLMKYSART